ncbi:MAG: hypothetical protein IJV93_03390 [Lentisphaeria bacterium]|nr:hypothetical protein [Lentisphaeria bacterium]
MVQRTNPLARQTFENHSGQFQSYRGLADFQGQFHHRSRCRSCGVDFEHLGKLPLRSFEVQSR